MLDVPMCTVCATVVFPPRALCPRCGSADWTSTVAEFGTLEQLTVANGTAVAAVRLDVGPVIIARGGSELESGDRVIVSLVAGTLEATPARRRDDGDRSDVPASVRTEKEGFEPSMEV